MWEVTERAMRMGSSLLPEMAGNIPITLLKTGVPVRAGKTIKGKRYFFYQGTGKLAGVRVENKSLTNKKKKDWFPCSIKKWCMYEAIL